MLSSLQIESIILTLRDQKIILDADHAKVYGVSTKRLNEQVKRNRKRFPPDFMFQLSDKEKDKVVANCDHLEKLRFSRTRPFAFTEYGAFMAANISNSRRAVAMSVYVIRAFVKFREAVNLSYLSKKRFAVIEKTLLEHDHTLKKIIEHIKPLLLPPPEKPKRKMGFYIQWKPIQ